MLVSYEARIEDIVKSAFILTGEDTLSTTMRVLDSTSPQSLKLKEFFLGAVSGILEDFSKLDGMPRLLQERITITASSQDSDGVCTFVYGKDDVYKVNGVYDKKDKRRVRREGIYEDFYNAKDKVYCESYFNIKTKNTSDNIIVYYVSKAIYVTDPKTRTRTTRFESGNQYILLDNDLLKLRIARDFVSTQDGESIFRYAPLERRYQERLRALIDTQKGDKNFSFSLITGQYKELN